VKIRIKSEESMAPEGLTSRAAIEEAATILARRQAAWRQQIEARAAEYNRRQIARAQAGVKVRPKNWRTA